MGCVRSVGYCRGDEERLDWLEPDWLAVSGVRKVESTVCLLVAEEVGEGEGEGEGEGAKERDSRWE
jgi:hypothetical protein